jgi:phospholipid/cholesterol/gamma-HCH transport system permease protein
MGRRYWRTVPPGVQIESVGGMAALAARTLVEFVTPGPSWRREFLIQMVFIFKASVLTVVVVNLFLGFSGAGIQGGGVLAQFGAADRTAAVVPVAFLREIGPLITGSVIAGLVGTTITAEFGARKIREEIDALAVLGIDPIRNMVLPRIVALAVVMLVLNMFALLASVVGAYIGAVGIWDAPSGTFLPQLLTNTSFIDLWASEIKVFAFGILIGIIASYKGLIVKGGAEGVGRAVNESVVASLVAIFFVSLLYTQLFLALYPEVTVIR